MKITQKGPRSCFLKRLTVSKDGPAHLCKWDTDRAMKVPQNFNFLFHLALKRCQGRVSSISAAESACESQNLTKKSFGILVSENFIISFFDCSSLHKGHLTSKLIYRRFPFYLLCTLLLFPFCFFTFPSAPTGFSLFLPWLPYHFYLVVFEQQQQQRATVLRKYLHRLR